MIDKGRLSMFVIALALAVSAPANGQSPAPDPVPALEAMKSLSFLEGRWAGEGWMQRGPGPREEFSQTETVEWRLDGGVLLIEGVGKSKSPETGQRHHAFAVVSFNPMTEKYRFTSYVVGRPPLDVEPIIETNTLTWEFEPQSGSHIRYTAIVAEDTWHEIGEFSRDGNSWVQFFEMTLKKQHS